MRTRTKVIIAIVAAFLWVFLRDYFDYQRAAQKAEAAMTGQSAIYADDTSLFLLRQWYREYNDLYFDNSLPSDTTIDFNLKDGTMASTGMVNFQRFNISFDYHYVAAQRTGRFTLLHEMCHIKTWGEMEDGNHGPRWRTCMLAIDQQGEFRTIIIDKYRGN